MKNNSKKTIRKIIFLTLLFTSTFTPLFAQVFQHKKYDLVAKKDSVNLKETIVINNKIFKIYNNWLSGGGGQAYNSALTKSQFVWGADYNFHIQAHYYQLGFLLAGDAFGNYNNTQLHICYGGRKENEVFNLAYFIGPSYAIIYPKDSTGYSVNSVSAFGVFGEVQMVRKISYDTGIGADIFVNVNSYQTIAGLRIILYFSGAYQGLKNKYADKAPTIY
ncbi:MAG: hypothetical protein ABI199_08685 [Bacteroidia bacterium]